MTKKMIAKRDRMIGSEIIRTGDEVKVTKDKVTKMYFIETEKTTTMTDASEIKATFGKLP